MGTAQVKKLGLLALLVTATIAGTAQGHCFYMVDINTHVANPSDLSATVLVFDKNGSPIWSRRSVRPGSFMVFEWDVPSADPKTCQRPCRLKISLENGEIWQPTRVQVRAFDTDVVRAKFVTTFFPQTLAATSTVALTLNLDCL